MPGQFQFDALPSGFIFPSETLRTGPFLRDHLARVGRAENGTGLFDPRLLVQLGPQSPSQLALLATGPPVLPVRLAVDQRDQHSPGILIFRPAQFIQIMEKKKKK